MYNFILRLKKKKKTCLNLDLGSISCLLVPAAFTSEPPVKYVRTAKKPTDPHAYIVGASKLALNALYIYEREYFACAGM